MSEELTPAVNAAIDGVWKSHKGLAEDQVISVLHEAVKSAGGDLPSEEYDRIGRAIADGSYHDAK
jgi:hypothetical protein